MLEAGPMDMAALALELRCLGKVAVLGSRVRLVGRAVVREGAREAEGGGVVVVLVLIPLGIMGQYLRVCA